MSAKKAKPMTDVEAGVDAAVEGIGMTWPREKAVEHIVRRLQERFILVPKDAPPEKRAEAVGFEQVGWLGLTPDVTVMSTHPKWAHLGEKGWRPLFAPSPEPEEG